MLRALLITLLFASCSPASRYTRLIKKYPFLIERSDTVIITETPKVDTVFYKSFNDVDTFKILETKTTVINKPGKIEVVQVPIRDTIRVTRTIKPKEKPGFFVPLEKPRIFEMLTLLLIAFLLWKTKKKN